MVQGTRGICPDLRQGDSNSRISPASLTMWLRSWSQDFFHGMTITADLKRPETYPSGWF
jgi:hypothetical protein